MAALQSLSQKEEEIIRDQISKNSIVINLLIYKIDLLVNREGHKNDSIVLIKLRNHLDVLMSENDTFRKVFWSHVQKVELTKEDVNADALRYLFIRIRDRQQAACHSLLADYEIGTMS